MIELFNMSNMSRAHNITQLSLYNEVFGTRKKWFHRTDDILIGVQLT